MNTENRLKNENIVINAIVNMDVKTVIDRLTNHNVNVNAKNWKGHSLLGIAVSVIIIEPSLDITSMAISHTFKAAEPEIKGDYFNDTGNEVVRNELLEVLINFGADTTEILNGMDIGQLAESYGNMQAKSSFENICLSEVIKSTKANSNIVI